MSLADALAVARAISVVPIWWALAVDARAVALALFVVAALSDAADGWAARRYGSTRHGALLDPLADKVLVLGTALSLMLAGALPVPLFAMLAARELAVAVLRLRAFQTHRDRPADAAGKLKTAAEMTALALLIVARPPDAVALAGEALLLLAILAGLLTLARRWPRQRRQPI